MCGLFSQICPIIPIGSLGKGEHNEELCLVLKFKKKLERIKKYYSGVRGETGVLGKKNQKRSINQSVFCKPKLQSMQNCLLHGCPFRFVLIFREREINRFHQKIEISKKLEAPEHRAFQLQYRMNRAIIIACMIMLFFRFITQ